MAQQSGQSTPHPTISVEGIEPADRAIAAEIQQAIDSKTKPLGSLGRIEDLAKTVCLVQQTTKPEISKPIMVVFAGNHGVTQSGVSAYPSEVTGQMILNFLAGGAAINVLCQSFGIDLEIVNTGVTIDIPSALMSDRYIDVRVGDSTSNFTVEAAMTSEQCEQAIEIGRHRVSAHVANGSNLFLLGEMGIGNTSSAACITSLVTDTPIEVCVGRGTGLTDEGLAQKTSVLSAALSHHNSPREPGEVLATFGGFEIAAMVGAILESAKRQCVVVVDGYIATAAALIAFGLAPATRDFMVFSHRSQEPGHIKALDFMNVRELLSLDLRLGEGSGAACAFPLVQAAVNIMRDMATFESASVSEATQG